jgi:signal transduction histidine kinase
MPRLTFDAEGIHRAVLNVVTNALDAVEGRENGLVEIETAHDAAANVAHVTISDNGVGIPPDQVGQIFNLFTSNKGARGTGLGLAVSRKIMNEHGGTIRVQSTPEQGSRFVLELPAQAPNGQTQA